MVIHLSPIASSDRDDDNLDDVVAATATDRDTVHAARAVVSTVLVTICVTTVGDISIINTVVVVVSSNRRTRTNTSTSTDTDTTSTGTSTMTVTAPASLVREHGIAQLIGAVVAEGHVAVQGDVVEAPVPDGRVDHAVRGKGHDGADDGSGKDVVPVVVLVDGEGAADQARAEDGHVDDDELPHGGVLVFCQVSVDERWCCEE